MLFIVFVSLLPVWAIAEKDVELDMTVPEIIQFYKYSFELHHVTTKDGYILDLHRIPEGRDIRPIPFLEANLKSRPVVVMMHGIFSDSFSFVPNPPVYSAGFVFADAGFDVWLLNCRGTVGGMKHVMFSPDDRDFWKFTWYDHATRDLPDSIDYILKTTGEKSVYYFAHGQGTILGFTRLAEDPDKSFAKKIRQFFALGPVGGFKDIKNLLFDLPAIEPIYDIQQLLGNVIGNVPLKVPPWLQKLIYQVCNVPIGSLFCQIATSTTPFTEKNGQLNESREAVYLRHFPAPTSLSNILHWSQIIHFRELRKFDYGKQKNLKIYGQEEAPKIDISTITTPTYLYYSNDDHMVTASDAKEFVVSEYGPGLKGHYSLDHFTHIDFVVGLRAVEEVYKPIIQTIYEDLKERATYVSLNSSAPEEAPTTTSPRSGTSEDPSTKPNTRLGTLGETSTTKSGPRTNTPGDPFTNSSPRTTTAEGTSAKSSPSICLPEESSTKPISKSTPQLKSTKPSTRTSSSGEIFTKLSPTRSTPEDAATRSSPRSNAPGRGTTTLSPKTSDPTTQSSIITTLKEASTKPKTSSAEETSTKSNPLSSTSEKAPTKSISSSSIPEKATTISTRTSAASKASTKPNSSTKTQDNPSTKSIPTTSTSGKTYSKSSPETSTPGDPSPTKSVPTTRTTGGVPTISTPIYNAPESSKSSPVSTDPDDSSQCKPIRFVLAFLLCFILYY